MRLLFFGDIVGKIGRQALKKVLPGLREKFKPDLILANGENLAHGKGVTPKVISEVLLAGVDYLTSGNHFFSRREVEEVVKKKMPIIRPANYPLSSIGEGWALISKDKFKILLVNLLGKTFIENERTILSHPFLKIEEILEKFPEIKIRIVDFHAEATSEKNALFYWLEGKVSLLVGTHTHIQTADEKISSGTAYLTDLGFVGAKDSVLGIKKELSIDYLLGRTEKLRIEAPEKGEALVQGVFVKIDEKTGQAKKIKRINEKITID